MKSVFRALLLSSVLLPGLAAGAPVSTPKEVLGHVMGEDRYVASYTEFTTYIRALEKQSDRIRVLDIGETTEKRRQLMAVVSSPENLALIDAYRDISARLGAAEGLTEDQARDLAARGKAIVWVDAGIHASEVETHVALIQQVYDLVSSEDAEARKIRENVIILFAADNPDGQEHVANWYMRFKDPKDRETNFSSLPKLYHPYIGHDNNRDFYMAEMAETQNITRVLYRDWRPQIVLNQHQVGPAGTVVFIPPFRDPFNYNYNPLVITSLEEVGATLNSRLLSENKYGATTRSGAHYDTWTNGNLRTSTYFHNTIGLLTEIIGSVVPEPIPLVPERQLPGNDQPSPVAPQMWTMAQSLQYSLSINRATLSYAAANREKLLYNFYHMGRTAIEKGSRDNWTVTPGRIAAMHAASAASGAKPTPTRTRGSSAIDSRFYSEVLQAPENRDARAYLISPQQHDFPTAVRFLNALIKLGVKVERATKDFEFDGKPYPTGTYIVPAAQAYRAHVRDMFEPQDYAQRFEYPGGPPIPPADASGYTLAYQMGVEFTRAQDAVSAPTETTTGLLKPYAGTIRGEGAAGFVISHKTNNSFILSNRLLKAGQKVFWLTQAAQTASGSETGALWVPATPKARAIVTKAVAELGIDVLAVAQAPTQAKMAVKAPRIALFNLYGGLMPTGWTRWMFDQFEFNYTVVYPKELDQGSLNAKFDVVLFPDAALPNPLVSSGGGMFKGRFEVDQPKPETIPAEYRSWLGTISETKTLPALRRFVAKGGTVVALGSSSQGIVDSFKLPIANATAEVADGKPKALPRNKFYIPGALLTAQVDQSSPLGYGMTPEVDLFFDNNPTFRVPDGVNAHVAVKFGDRDQLHSGWAWGLDYLDNAAAVVDLPVEKGRVVLFGPEVAMRAQTQGAFKLLFNALYWSAAHGTTRSQ